MTFPFPDVSASSLTELLSLEGRVAVVTGAAQGLGLAIAHRLAEAGASTVVADLRLEDAERAAAAIASRHGVDVLGVEMDVTEEASIVSAADRVVAELGGVNIWVNNAGVFPSAPAVEMTLEAWEEVFAVNSRGVFLGARTAARRMAGSGGVVVNVVSTAGFGAPAPGLAAYVGSKHAARGITKALALELAPAGIRVLGVAPTYVPTEGTMAMAAAGAERAAAAGVEPPPMDVMNQSLIGRLGTPDDIARVVLFAASDLAIIMTGSTLLADAGETIK